MLQVIWNCVVVIVGRVLIVVVNQEYCFMVVEQLCECSVVLQVLIFELIGCNIVLVIVIVVLQVLVGGEDVLLLVLLFDYVVCNDVVFYVVVKQVVVVVDVGKLVIFGIVLMVLEIGYGYIKVYVGEGVCGVDCFVEKLNLEIVQQYVSFGEYYWNSGMFLFKVFCYLQELEVLQLVMLVVCCVVLDKVLCDSDFICLDVEVFVVSFNDLIDYVVMEKIVDVVVVLLDVGWNDVGFWLVLWDVLDKDVDGNVCYGDVIVLDCCNSYVYGICLIVMVGLEDVVVVEIDDVVFVGYKDCVQDVKEIVGQIKCDGCSEVVVYCKVYCLWGVYDFIDNGVCFQVKCIMVKFGVMLSLQMYYYCVEYWIVVSGIVEVICGDEVILFIENQSIYILFGVIYCFKNLGKLLFELIEVQLGSYFGEDDIVWFEDQYGCVQ